MYPHHVFNLEPAGTFGMYPICYQQVSGRYFQPEPAMYSRCFHWFSGPLAPSVEEELQSSRAKMTELEQKMMEQDRVIAQLVGDNLDHLQDNMHLTAHINSSQE